MQTQVPSSSKNKKNRKRPKYNNVVLILVFFLALLCVILFGWGGKDGTAKLDFSEDYLLLQEIPPLMSFTYYDEAGWESRIQGKNTEKFSYQDLEGLLDMLHLKDYVTYEKKEKGQAVSRQVFFGVYDQIRDLLDENHQVSTADLIFLQEKLQNDSEQDSQNSQNTSNIQDSTDNADSTKEATSAKENPLTIWLTQNGEQILPAIFPKIKPYDMYETVFISGKIAGFRAVSTATVTWKNVFVHYAGTADDNSTQANASDNSTQVKASTPVSTTDSPASHTQESLSAIWGNSSFTIPIVGLTESITDTICDIDWQNGAVAAVHKKPDTITGTILAFDDTGIEIAGYGRLPYEGGLRIFKTYGTVEQVDHAKLSIGNLRVDVTVANGNACGIILREPATMELIRVLLLNGESPYREELYLTADTAFTMNQGESSEDFSAGSVVKISDHLTKDGTGAALSFSANTTTDAPTNGTNGTTANTATDAPTNGTTTNTATDNPANGTTANTPTGQIFLSDESGKRISLGYSGKLEVRAYPDGYCLVNELSLEDYLCHVVPSEMPASYEAEALRAQAICARSYACIQLKKGDYAALGANVDDSTRYQVYNKQGANERTTLAVRDTAGEVLQYQGEIAEAYYYSTSCGVSQDMSLWGHKEDPAYGYLVSNSLLLDESVLDFSKTPATAEREAVDHEQVFAEFIKSQDVTAYDSGSPYFRWKAQLDYTGKKDSMGAVIASQKKSGSFVTYFDQNGTQTDADLASFGNITSLQTEERSKGGAMVSLRIQYEKGSVRLSSESVIRKVLFAGVTELSDKGGGTITGLPLLPSACFFLIPVESGYVLYGGGYGHGIGLSQNGANGMAKAGLSYLAILQKFYTDISVENIY